MENLTLDKQEIERLAKVVKPTHQDMESIYSLYTKYVDANAPRPRMSGCTTCGSSIVSYWRKLIDWFQNNQSVFEGARAQTQNISG